MIDNRRKRSILAYGLAVSGVAAAAYIATFVAGCGSSSEAAPPNTAAQGQAESTSADGAGGGKHHGHHAPPQAAFDACKDKAVGTTCTAQIGDDEISGMCEAAPPGSTQTGTACRPEGGRRHKPHGPPPEAVFSACDGKTAGDACSVTLEKGPVSGSCMAPRHHDAGAERLLCASAHPHGHEQPGSTPAAGGK